MGLVLAFFGGLVAHRLRLPPLVGYLLAGVALGPFTPGFVGDANLASKVALFVALVFLVGTRVVPWLLQLVARTGSRELFILSVLAIAHGIAYGSAELFGLSFALGAFFAGVVLSESDFSYQAAADSDGATMPSSSAMGASARSSATA